MASVLASATASGPGFTALLSAVRDVYSAEIYFDALPIMRFDQFATHKEELGSAPGSTIIMNKMGGIKRGGRLYEGVRIKTQGMGVSSSSISVDERGNAIGMTERLLQTSFYDNLAAASMLLGRDMALVLDTELRDVARTSTTKVYGGKKLSRNSLTAADVMTTSVIHDVVEQLETTNSPRWNNDFYVMFTHPHCISTLRQSPGWVNVMQYNNGGNNIFFGEVGRYNDMRFISTSIMPNGKSAALDGLTGEYADPGYDPLLDKTVTSALNVEEVYQSVAFGEYAYGHAVALPTELRDNGVTDFGREHALAWYAIWGQGLLEVKNICVVETA